MKPLAVISIAVLLLTVMQPTAAQQRNLIPWVNPLIGSVGEGHVFPGASLPYGMVKLGPDCGELTSNSGYTASDKIKGFSHIHVSGTGGGPKYGNILVQGLTGKLDPENYGSKRSSEEATPGYYRVRLTDYEIKAEMTVTEHVGYLRFQFPEAPDAKILIDCGSFLRSSYKTETQSLVASEIHIVSRNEMKGYTRLQGGWNMGGPYTVYFYAMFDTPSDVFGTWESGSVTEFGRDAGGKNKASGAYFQYKTEQDEWIEVKVGISFISEQKAKLNLMTETSGWNFSQIKMEAEQLWNEKLNKIIVEGGSEAEYITFYSALYRTMLMPVDRTGENPLWESQEPYFDDFYAIWDTYRTTNPLLTIIQAREQSNMIRALLDIYRHEGYMPDARSGNYNGRTQGGSNCDVLITDAFVKGLDSINYELALEAMLKNATTTPRNHEKEGRGGIEEYIKLGYVPVDTPRAGTRTLEYAYNDYCIGVLAQKTGKTELAEAYFKRANNWQNLWKPIQSEGITGFIMPKKKDGNWAENYKETDWDTKKEVPFTPLSAGSWNSFFYESNSWEYSLYAPHDMAKLIERCGGKEAFTARLDTLFNKGNHNIGNEPGFLIPCLYNYAARADRTCERVFALVDKHFRPTPDGLPGNDDAGAMSAWYIFHAMGFFPVAGQDVYLITTPVFKRTVIDMGNGKTFEILADGLTKDHFYVQAALLNDREYYKSWFTHSDLKKGGTLILEMDDEPSEIWGVDDLPPSSPNQFH